jgi:hypothetical protein
MNYFSALIYRLLANPYKKRAWMQIKNKHNSTQSKKIKQNKGGLKCCGFSASSSLLTSIITSILVKNSILISDNVTLHTS